MTRDTEWHDRYRGVKVTTTVSNIGDLTVLAMVIPSSLSGVGYVVVQAAGWSHRHHRPSSGREEL